MDLLPERRPRQTGWWSFASTNVLLGVGLTFTVSALAWAAVLPESFTWAQLLAIMVLGALGLFYLIAGVMSAESTRNRRPRVRYSRRRPRGAHAPRPAAPRSEPRVYA